MKGLVLTGLMALSGLAAFGATVTYSTSGTVCPTSAACSATSQTVGDVEVKFNNIASSTVNAAPSTFASLGEIDFTCVNPSSGTAESTSCTEQNFTGIFITINIVQTAPTGGSANIIGSLSGTVSGMSSNASITWSTTSGMIGDIKYMVTANTLALAAPSTNNGQTSVQAQISDMTVPEPSTYALIGGALLGLGALRRRK
jgi:hypothetical protein